MSPTAVSMLLLALVFVCWAVALWKRSRVRGDEEVLLDIAAPPAADWLVLAVCAAAAGVLFWLFGGWTLAEAGGRFEPSLATFLFPLALLLTGLLMFVDNLPAAITVRGLRRGLSITPWSELVGWHWDEEDPHVLVLRGRQGADEDDVAAVPVTDPKQAGGAPETPALPSPDDFADWDGFRTAIEAALAKHLPTATTAA